MLSKLNYILYILALLSGGAGAWIICKYGHKLGLLDKPNDRSSHCRPTPKGGGIGILVAFVLASLFLQVPLSFWITAIFLGLLSFFDPQITSVPSAGATPVRSDGPTGRAGQAQIPRIKNKMKDERTYKIIGAALEVQSTDFAD